MKWFKRNREYKNILISVTRDTCLDTQIFHLLVFSLSSGHARQSNPDSSKTSLNINIYAEPALAYMKSSRDFS